MTKYPPQEGYNALLDTGAIVENVTRPQGKRRWQGTNNLNPKHPTIHFFNIEDVVFAAPQDIWAGALVMFREEQLKKQKELRR